MFLNIVISLHAVRKFWFTYLWSLSEKYDRSDFGKLNEPPPRETDFEKIF